MRNLLARIALIVAIGTPMVAVALPSPASASGSLYPAGCKQYAAGNDWTPNCYVSLSPYVYYSAADGAVQYIVRDSGYPLGIVDCFFGSNTWYATKRFQRDRSLAQDGIVGPSTWQALRARMIWTGYFFGGTNGWSTYTVGSSDRVDRFQMGDYISADGRYGPWSLFYDNVPNKQFLLDVTNSCT